METIRNNNLFIQDYSWIKYFSKLPPEAKKTVDLVKLTSFSIMSGEISEKDIKNAVSICKEGGTTCYLGGGMTELALSNGEMGKYINYLKSFGIDTVEISNSLGNEIDSNGLHELVKLLKGEFNKVLVEVGAKNEGIFSKYHEVWGDSIDASVDAGADGIIIEGTTCGDVGIYENNEVKTFLLLYIMKKLNENQYRGDIIVESALPFLQEYIISLLGPNIKLGNIIAYNQFDGIEKVNGIRDEFKDFYSDSIKDKFVLVNTIFESCREHNIDPNFFFFNPNYYNLDFTSDRINEYVKDIKKNAGIYGEWNKGDYHFPLELLKLFEGGQIIIHKF